jgi:hypothetical protein
MELFGIVLSIQIAFVASMLYRLLLDRTVLMLQGPSRWLRRGSLLILALFAAELILLATIGPVRSRGILGPGFYAAHLVLFFLGPPALANLLVLRPRGGGPSKWYVAAVTCTLFAFFLVLLQYSVSESLYGINDNGPYSEVVHSPTCALGSSKPLPSRLLYL